MKKYFFCFVLITIGFTNITPVHSDDYCLPSAGCSTCTEENAGDLCFDDSTLCMTYGDLYCEPYKDVYNIITWNLYEIRHDCYGNYCTYYRNWGVLAPS
jgi:hypothetical protein